MSQYEIRGGMSLRDWFAGKALQAILSDPSWRQATLKIAGHDGLEFNEAVGRCAYEFADSMLKARENVNGND